LVIQAALASSGSLIYATEGVASEARLTSRPSPAWQAYMPVRCSTVFPASFRLSWETAGRSS